MTTSTEQQGPDVEALVALWKATRVPDQAIVGKLPKITCRDCSRADSKVCGKHAKSECKTCHAYMTGAHMHLDYVGHADVTEVLLDADPLWNWEPCAWTEDGEPKMTVREGTARLWIRLTVHGMTRLGVGTCGAKKEDAEKECIGDALRNAAMRFGIAVTLWSKAEGMHVSDETPEPADEDACPTCKQMVAGARSDKEVMRLHVVDVHGWTRNDDGTVAPPKSDERPQEATESAPKPPAPPPTPPEPPADTEPAEVEPELAEYAEAIVVHEGNLPLPQRQLYRAWCRSQNLSFNQQGGVDVTKLTLDQAKTVEAHLTEMLTEKAPA